MWMWQETLLQKFVKFGVNLTFFAPWLPWQRPPFWIFFNPQKLPHTTVDIPTKFHEVWWKESKNFLNPLLFCFHGNCGKVCPTDSDFFGLSRSTRCGCCTYMYQVSSIYVRPFWRFPWQRQPFWKNQPLKAQLHMAYDIPTRFHKVWSRHLR